MSAEMSDREKQEARGTVCILCPKHGPAKVSMMAFEREPGHGCPECQKAKEAGR